MTRETRREAYGRGQRAEALAAWWLRLKGYRILARGFRVAAGEIDLIARRGRLIALVEVKARPSLEEAGAAILPRQRERIARGGGLPAAPSGTHWARPALRRGAAGARTLAATPRQCLAPRRGFAPAACRT